MRECQRFVELDPKLPAVLRGELTPANPKERLEFAKLCQHPAKKLHAAAARLYAEAFAADGKLAADLDTRYRYNAACGAALAAAGQSTDAAALDDWERARLRNQGLDWLRDDLDLWKQRLQSGKPEDRQTVRKTLLGWQQDADLTGVRDTETLKKLPVDEQEPWRQLWADVADMLKKADDLK